jgi:D-cysteine desulfhydrase
MSDFLASAHPLLGKRLPRLAIASLPTPISAHTLSLPRGDYDVYVKHDDLTSALYGGNKVRKLEYLLQRALDRGAKRVATFGAVGSNHALATAMHARAQGLGCTCFLSHQRATPKISSVLNMHRKLGTEVIRWGSSVDVPELYRKHLQERQIWVIPLGGTCWLGSVGFVVAGLELAQQIQSGAVVTPDRIYIAAGTTGSAAGLALGLSAGGVDTTVHAIQVADNPFGSEQKMRKLIDKTLFILNRIDPTFVARDVHDRIVWRDEFLAGGYAKVNEVTTAAVAVARKQLGVTLETTYTGKAMAAMHHDLQAPGYRGGPCLFWNTYNSSELEVDTESPASPGNIPAEFERYFDEKNRSRRSS